MSERFTLVLSGGSALGAYQAGAYEALHGRGMRPDRIVGASVGGVNAAIVAAAPPDRRVQALRAFWEAASQYRPAWAIAEAFWRDGRTRALQSPLMGSPAVFRPRLPGALSLFPGMPGDNSLFDLAPLRRTLERTIDFDRLNDGSVAVTVVATDVVTGEEVRFHSGTTPIGPDHLLASCGFIPFFPPVEIDGRLIGDGALSANLPIEAALEEEDGSDDRFCIALDLIRRRSAPPRTVGQAVDRQLELLLSDQTRRALRHQRDLHRMRRLLPEDDAAGREGATTVLVLVHDGVPDDVELRPFDYSTPVIAERWVAGRRDMEAAMDQHGSWRAGRDGFAVRIVTGRNSFESYDTIYVAACP